MHEYDWYTEETDHNKPRLIKTIKMLVRRAFHVYLDEAFCDFSSLLIASLLLLHMLNECITGNIHCGFTKLRTTGTISGWIDRACLHSIIWCITETLTLFFALHQCFCVPLHRTVLWSLDSLWMTDRHSSSCSCRLWRLFCSFNCDIILSTQTWNRNA